MKRTRYYSVVVFDIRIHQGDVTDLDLINREVRRHDFIIPLAAIVGAPHAQQIPREQN
ncbi:MAG: hypothetical protein CM1200mP41_24480 [Gammaproteobacteria bacterium]|nr:MAG: hypothetical protein CM1200mP41_24480 [Gammaproteobacteria bacterium]